MKQLKIFASALLALTLSVSAVSCGDDDDDPAPQQPAAPADNGGSEGGSEGGGSNGSVDIYAQKAYLEETAREFLNKVHSNDFQTLADLGKYISENYLDNDYYGDSELTDWFNAAMDLCLEPSTSNVVTKYLIQAANFLGEFEAGQYGWVKKNTGAVDHLRFTVYDGSRRKNVLTVSASKDFTKVYDESFDNVEYDRIWDYYYYQYRYNVYNTDKFTIAVPKTISVELTQDGTVLAKTDATISISPDNVTTINLQQINAKVTVDATVAGYSVNVSEASWASNGVVKTTATVSKGSEQLLSVNTTANATVVVSHKTTQTGTEIELDEDKITPNSAQVQVDILGRVKINGSASKAQNLVSLFDELYDNDRNETAFKNTLASINSIFDVKAVLVGSDNAEVRCNLIAAADEHYNYIWNGSSYERVSYDRFYPTPAVNFSDGTSYSFESFFDEATFRGVTNLAESLKSSFERLVSK